MATEHALFRMKVQNRNNDRCKAGVKPISSNNSLDILPINGLL